MRPIIATLLITCLVSAISCSSDSSESQTNAKETIADTSASAIPAAATILPPLSASRPDGVPAWAPDELWNAPRLEPRFPPAGSIDSFTGYSGDGVFRLPQDIQPGSNAHGGWVSGTLACALPTTAFPEFLVQPTGNEVELALKDPDWIDFVSPTGYEYYECVYDITGEITADRHIQDPEQDLRVEIIRLDSALTAPLPDYPVYSNGLRPEGPCQHPLPWEGFNNEFVSGGGVLLPSGIIKVACLVKSTSKAEEPEGIPMVHWPASAFEVAGLGPRRLPALVLRSDQRQLETEDLISAWRGHLQQTVIADNERGIPIMALCLNSNGVWLGKSEPWDQIEAGESVNWKVEFPGEYPGHPASVTETPNSAVVRISDDTRGGREIFPLSAGTSDDEGVQFVVTELRDPSVCGG